MELQRRKHLLSALEAYITDSAKGYELRLDNKKHIFEFEKVIKRIEGDKEYTPYCMYSSEGISLRDIRREYSFLKSEDMRTVVQYTTAENYLYSIFESLTTEYVRGFSPDRKIALTAELERVLMDVWKKSIAAKKCDRSGGRG